MIMKSYLISYVMMREIYNDHPQESNSLSNQSAPSKTQSVPLAAPKETGSS